MRAIEWHPGFRWLCCLLCALLMSGCGGGEGASAAVPSGAPTSAAHSQNAASQAASRPAASRRPNAPQVYAPTAPGDAVLGEGPVRIDVSNAAQGYVMACYNGSAAKANIQLTGPDGINYKYFLPPSEDWVSLPLSGGSGTYAVDAYENIVDTRYAVLFKETLEVQLENDLLPFLYPNQFVDFNAGSRCVEKASQTVADAADDLEAVAAIYHYVVENTVYDQQKADTVPSGYLPDVDETLESGTGICFDFASLTAAMLRSQNIPARLEIGYSGQVYHAWISVYTAETGWIDNAIEFTGDAWTRMDPTFASTNNSSKAVLQYIGDGNNYTVQYMR